MSDSRYDDLEYRIERFFGRLECGKVDCFDITCQECPLYFKNEGIAARAYASALIYERRGELPEVDE